VRQDEALATIQDLPPDLNDFYRRAYTDLCCGESHVVDGCTRLLKVMMLAYQPLNVHEVSSVAGCLTINGILRD
jgi:hypothetical protein